MAVYFSDNGYIVCEADGTAKIFSFKNENPKKISSFYSKNEKLKSVAQSSNFLIYSTFDKKLFFVDFRKNKIELKVSKNVESIKIINSGIEKAIIFDSVGDVYKICENGQNGVETKFCFGSISPITSISVSPDKKWFAAADKTSRIRISRLDSIQKIESFCFGHQLSPTQLLFCGDLLVSGGRDNFLIVWDYKKGKLLFKIDFDLIKIDYFEKIKFETNIDTDLIKEETFKKLKSDKIGIKTVKNFGNKIAVLCYKLKY
ncbi:tRNA (guanine-N(7)-)-methyltransferase non-catalytic subunit trm82, variant 2 [Bonamia ostreae]|uniref:tRNA (Guanine-N(7)-)-methyltransferase non-catalytic subunit trm82, variant 2 n=1 Tax=Bonamia ostreae TaxID=126728 RepID=A0ABV2AR46_9EUKA